MNSILRKIICITTRFWCAMWNWGTILCVQIVIEWLHHIHDWRFPNDLTKSYDVLLFYTGKKKRNISFGVILYFEMDKSLAQTFGMGSNVIPSHCPHWSHYISPQMGRHWPYCEKTVAYYGYGMDICDMWRHAIVARCRGDWLSFFHCFSIKKSSESVEIGTELTIWPSPPPSNLTSVQWEWKQRYQFELFIVRRYDICGGRWSWWWIESEWNEN